MPKPTQAEVANLVGRLHRDADRIWDDEKLGAPAAPDSFEDLTARLEREAADAIEALAGEGAEPVAWRWIPNEHHRYTYSEQNPLFTFGVEPLYAAPPAKPAGELPVQIEPSVIEEGFVEWNRIRKDGEFYLIDAWRAAIKYALRALRERA